MGKAKKEVQVDDDDAIFAQRAMELKGASPPGLPFGKILPRRSNRLQRSTKRGVKNTPSPHNFPVVSGGVRRSSLSASLDPRRLTLRLSDTTDEAKALFSKGYPVKAAAAYDQALKLVVPSDPLAGEMHRDRAGVLHVHMRQYADVVVEATRALKTNPSDPAALLYRAKAYELLGQGKKAKADAAAAAAADAGDDQQRGFVEAAKAVGARGRQARGRTRRARRARTRAREEG